MKAYTKLILLCQLFSTLHSTPIGLNEADVEIIEGDIVVDSKLKRVLAMAQTSVEGTRSRRQTETEDFHENKWKHGIIPITFDKSIPTSIRMMVKSAVETLHQQTCLIFRSRENETDYVEFSSEKPGCHSFVGRQGGRQVVNLGKECASTMIALHEIMHVLGLFHVQSRYDRDLYVKVLWWNIQEGARKNFEFYTHGYWDELQFPYDETSLLHYPNKAYSANEQDTLQLLESPGKRVGGDELSNLDLKQILKYYKCYRKIYTKRRAACHDKHHHVCGLFIIYPNLCRIHENYVARNCQLACRICDPERNHNPTRNGRRPASKSGPVF